MTFFAGSLLSEKPVRQLLLANFLASIATGIAAILIPWMLVKELDADRFSILAMLTTFAMIFFMPWVGRTIDSLKRKRVLISTSLAGAVFFLLLSFIERDAKAYWLLLLAAFVLMHFYFNMFYTARGALAQSLTGKQNYARLNGWLEIENQTAAFSAGTLAVLLLDLVSISAIFLVCMASLLCAAFSFAHVEEPHRQRAEVTQSSTVEKPAFETGIILLALAGSMPFVCIMLMNIIKPIFISEVLLADAQVLAMTSVCYTVGAVTSGGVSGWLMTKLGAYRALVLALWGFVIATGILMFYGSVEVLYLASLGWGLFNSLARITKQTIVMDLIENDVMGRFMALGQKLVLLIRSVVILGFSGLFLLVDYGYSFWYVSAIALCGPLLLGWCRKDVSGLDARVH